MGFEQLTQTNLPMWIRETRAFVWHEANHVDIAIVIGVKQATSPCKRGWDKKPLCYFFRASRTSWPHSNCCLDCATNRTMCMCLHIASLEAAKHLHVAWARSTVYDAQELSDGTVYTQNSGIQDHDLTSPTFINHRKCSWFSSFVVQLGYATSLDQAALISE